MPAYYRSALRIDEAVLVVYFAVMYVLFPVLTGRWEWFPAVMFGAAAACSFSNGRINSHLSFLAFGAVVLSWCAWGVYMVGWDCEVQYILILLMMLCFFNIYIPSGVKIGIYVLMGVCRIALYSYAIHYSPVCVLDRNARIIFQTVNSLGLFIMLAVDCILFSTSIQETERRLRLDNQELHKAAGTDPLTQLPNRRAMLDRIDAWMKESSSGRFSVAIADIDFFKKVNDTYGHNGGDYTLQKLAALFKEKAGDEYWVCRWGGEEFCFFMPEKNIDEAGMVIFDLLACVRKMQLSFEGHDFSITMTAGVAENDFRSSLSGLLEEADQKLYRGKLGGRNQVVI